jgi:hypothetical protein
MKKERWSSSRLAVKPIKPSWNLFANNPLFRGIWHGTERIYVNAVYFGQVIESTDLTE